MALAVSFVWLGEIPQPVELAGGMIIIAGVALINRRAATERTRRPEPAAVAGDSVDARGRPPAACC